MENLYKFTSIAQSSDTHPQYPHAKHIANHACSGIDIEWVGTTTKYAPVWCESAWHQIQRRKKKHKYNRQWTGHTSFTYTIWFHVCVCLWVVFRDVAGWLSGFLFFFFFSIPPVHYNSDACVLQVEGCAYCAAPARLPCNDIFIQ